MPGGYKEVLDPLGVVIHDRPCTTLDIIRKSEMSLQISVHLLLNYELQNQFIMSSCALLGDELVFFLVIGSFVINYVKKYVRRNKTVEK